MESRRVDSKLLLFTLVLVLIVLLLLNYIFNKNRTNDIWNYKEIESASDIISKGNMVNDREVFYTLENIVTNYLESYINVYNEEDKIMYDDYYNYLAEDYKNYLSKKEYKQVAKTFLDKFYISIGSDYETMDTNRILKNVYEFENNVYLCELKGNKSKEVGYIAFQLNTNNLAYNIVYIE